MDNNVERIAPRMTSLLALEDLGVSLRSNERREVSLHRLIVALDGVVQADGGYDEPALLGLMSKLLHAGLKAVEASDGALLVQDEETTDLVFALIQGEISDERLAWRRISGGAGFAGWAVDHREVVNVSDAQSDPRFLCDIDAETGFVTHSVLAVPIIRNQRTLGVVEALNKARGQVFSRHDEALIGSVATGAALILDLLSREG